jgi:hypothetical protein
MSYTEGDLVPGQTLAGVLSQLDKAVRVGTLAARPAATAGAGFYIATNDNGGTLYYSTGAAWVQAAQGVTAVV